MTDAMDHSGQTDLFGGAEREPRRAGERLVTEPDSSAGLEVRRARQRAALVLHGTLSELLGRLDLHITDNRRRMITVRRKPSRVELRLHHMFLDADEVTIEAVARFAQGDEAAREVIRAFIRSRREVIRKAPRGGELRGLGEVHDLDELLERCRERFEGVDLDDVVITWGRDGKGRRSIRFGCFDFERRLIRMHPALDADWVPSYFVEFIVHHELCHAVVPPMVQGGRRILHSEEFRVLERQFPLYERAMAWEGDHLHRFLNR